MSVALIEHDTVAYEVIEFEPVAPLTQVEKRKGKLFPNVVSLVPVLVLLEASLVLAGMASYHIGVFVVSRVHLIH